MGDGKFSVVILGKNTGGVYLKIFPIWLPGLGSNQRMTDSKSVALPLGDRAISQKCQYAIKFFQRAVKKSMRNF